jgi:hypothetical protein
LVTAEDLLRRRHDRRVRRSGNRRTTVESGLT